MILPCSNSLNAKSMLWSIGQSAWLQNTVAIFHQGSVCSVTPCPKGNAHDELVHRDFEPANHIFYRCVCFIFPKKDAAEPPPHPVKL